MRFISSSSRLNTLILILIAVSWLYTEITEYAKRNEFKHQIMEFIETIEHDRLLARVIVLEDECKRAE